MSSQDKVSLLVVSQNAYMRGILKFVIETMLNTEVKELESEEKALEYLKGITQYPAMIIYDYNPHAYLLEDFVKHLMEFSTKVQIVVLIDKVREEGKKLLSHIHQIKLMNEPSIPMDLVEEVKKVFGGTTYENTEEYCRIDLRFLTILDGINKNLFIKIGPKFVQLFQAQDNTEMLDLKKYMERGVDYLYLKRETATWVIEQIQKQISIFLKTNNFRFVLRGESESPEKKFEQKILRINDEVHIDDEFKESIVQAVDKIKGVVNKQSNLKDVLEQLRRHSDDYAYFTQKINATSLIATSLAKQLEWASKMTLDKLIFASVLCDITMAVRPQLMRIKNLDEFESMKDQLSEEDQKIFLSHPKDSANLIKRYFSAAPPETDILALQHHEMPDGNGFPFGMKADKISPLTALFIVAQDFAAFYLEEENPSFEEYMLRAQGKFDYVNFRKVIKALEKLKRKV